MCFLCSTRAALAHERTARPRPRRRAHARPPVSDLPTRRCLTPRGSRLQRRRTDVARQDRLVVPILPLNSLDFVRRQRTPITLDRAGPYALMECVPVAAVSMQRPPDFVGALYSAPSRIELQR